MKNSKIVIFIIAVILLGTSDISMSKVDDVVVIVNKSRQNLSREKIKDIFNGVTMKWPGGARIRILINHDKKIYTEFCKKYLNKSTRDIDDIWTRIHIRDGIPMPRRAHSNVVIIFVKNSPDCIGFVRRSQAKNNAKIIE